MTRERSGESCLPPARERAKDIERKRRIYADEAPTYDDEMDFFERRITGTEHRGWACSRAIGATLEVAIGTGLNLPHYPQGPEPDRNRSEPRNARRGPRQGPTLGSSRRVTRGRRSGPALSEQLIRHRGLHLRAVQRSRRCPGGQRDETCPQDQVAVSSWWTMCDHIPALFWFQWLYEFIPRRTKGEFMTRRPAQHVMATDFEIVDHDRLRAGIVERMVAVKR